MLLGCVWFDCCSLFQKASSTAKFKSQCWAYIFVLSLVAQRKMCTICYGSCAIGSKSVVVVVVLFCSLVLTLFVEFGDSYVRYVFSAVLQVKSIQLCISCAQTHTHSFGHIKYRCIAIINKSTQNVRVQWKKKILVIFCFACCLLRLSLGNFFLLWKRKKTHWCLSVLGLNLWCACCKHSTRNEKKETTQIYPNQVKISHATFQGKKKKYTDTLHIRLQKTKHPYTWVYLIRKSSI